MSVFLRILRAVKRRKPLSKLSVWTMDTMGRRFSYDISIFKLKRPGLFFVKFTRHSLSSGNTMNWHKVMNSSQVHELQHQAQ